ncbi:hypothetical protein J3R83DRAFT_5490 [Lanmaoa asiatica]|nr:hypothetical protein J3R83DRAFT_5490 [Lanmaoa asiatica]
MPVSRTEGNRKYYNNHKEHLNSDAEALRDFRKKRAVNQAAYRACQKIKAASVPQSGSSQPATPDPQSVPQVDRSPQVPARNFDFATGVRGVQVNASADAIAWPGGPQTIAPTLICNGSNFLKFDETYVRHVATFPEAMPESRYIDFLHRSSYADTYDLVTAIRQSLSGGHPAVVCDFQDADSFSLTEEGLLRIRYIPQHEDTGIRAANFKHPHAYGTISQFLSGINNPEECRFILDILLAQRDMPVSIGILDGGLTVGWN